MDVVITGATGFVGSWLARSLVEKGHNVSAIVRDLDKCPELKDLGVQLVAGDVTDKSSLDSAIKKESTVFHLAGVVGYSKAQRPLMDKVNVGGTQNIVDVCSEKQVSRLVYMSSVVAVGASFDGKEPLSEASPYNVKKLNLGYFETKRKAEEIVLLASREGQLDAVAVNPSTIYGPGDAKKGSRKTQLKVARGEFPFYTSGGVSIIHVNDVVDATLRAWEIGKQSERYILSGENITIKRLFEIIASHAGVKPPQMYLPNPIVHTLGKIGDGLESIGKKGPINSENAWTATLFHWFSNDKAKRELDLSPIKASEAIETSVNWMKQQGLLD